jgi:hypothetical protein
MNKMNGNIFLLLLLFNRETRLHVSSVVQPHECKGVKGKKKIYNIFCIYWVPNKYVFGRR